MAKNQRAPLPRVPHDVRQRLNRLLRQPVQLAQNPLLYMRMRKPRLLRVVNKLNKIVPATPQQLVIYAKQLLVLLKPKQP